MFPTPFHWSLVRWFAGSLVRWFVGSLVRWFAGSLVRWFAGSLVRWFVGVAGSLVRWFVIEVGRRAARLIDNAERLVGVSLPVVFFVVHFADKKSITL